MTSIDRKDLADLIQEYVDWNNTQTQPTEVFDDHIEYGLASGDIIDCPIEEPSLVGFMKYLKGKRVIKPTDISYD